MGESYHQACVDVTILIPAFNESGGLNGVISEVREALGLLSFEFEILVVDDGSTDTTAQIAHDANVKVLRRVQNFGYGSAVKLGICQARGRYIVLIDGDQSYNPSDILKLWPFVPEYDQVTGVRSRDFGWLSWIRRWTKLAVCKFAEYIVGRELHDLNCGLRIFNRDIARELLWTLPDGFSCSTSLTLAFVANAHTLKFVDIDYRPRMGESKFRPLRDGFRFFLGVLRMATYFNPLRVFLPLAAACAVLSAIFGAYHLSISPSGIADSDVILAVTACILASVGLLADLIVAQGRKRS